MNPLHVVATKASRVEPVRTEMGLDPCGRCGGTGVAGDQICGRCDGVGSIWR